MNKKFLFGSIILISISITLIGYFLIESNIADNNYIEELKEKHVHMRSIIGNNNDEIVFALNYPCDTLTPYMEQRIDYFICLWMQQLNLTPDFNKDIFVIKETEKTMGFDIGYGGSDSRDLLGDADILVTYSWDKGQLHFKRKKTTNGDIYLHPDSTNCLNNFRITNKYNDSYFIKLYDSMKK